MNKARICCCCVALVLLAACPRDQPFADGVVARYDGGVVTAQELEDRILVEPPGRRTPPQDSSISLADWKRRFARTIVAERAWFGSIDENEIRSDPRLSARLEGSRHALLTRFVLNEGLQLDAPVHEDEIRALYEERRPSLELPASYTVRHVYFRVDEGAPEEQWSQALARCEKIRELMIAPGANIDELVAEHSDSEDASLGGWIRQLRLGSLSLSPAFEDAVASLRPGEVSQPVRTRRGYQLVLLVDHRPQRTLAYNEIRDRLFQQIVTQRREERLAQVTAELRSSHPLEFDLEAFLSGDPEAVVILGEGIAVTRQRLGRIEPTLTGFLAQALDNDSDVWPEYVDRLIRGQWLLVYAAETGLDRSTEFEKQWRQQRFRIVVDHNFQQEYERWLGERDSQEMRKFYEDNKPRFSTPRSLHLSVLFVEHKSLDLYATYALAEELARRLRNGEPFSELIAAHSDHKGPSGDGDFGWNTHKQIAAYGKTFYDAVLGAEIGDWNGPVKWDRGYAVLRVEDVREPQSQSYDDAEERVRRAFSRRMKVEHFDAIVDEVFDEFNGELNDGWFESIAQ